MKAVLKSPALESWESLEAPADVCTPEVAAFALSHRRLCSQEPFQGPLFTLRPPQRPLEALVFETAMGFDACLDWNGLGAL